MAADNLFDLKIITPDRVFYSGKASFLELNTVEGGIGIYKNHIPMTTVLEPGIATITEEGGNKKEAALHTGFMISPTSISRGQSWHCTRHWSVSNWQTM